VVRLPENTNDAAGNGVESQNFKAGSLLVSSLPVGTVSPPTPLAVSRIKDAYAVLVIGKATRRHVLFGLPSAQRAVDRARARGDYAELVLVRLVPVGEALR
jgi:hypothetical protein